MAAPSLLIPGEAIVVRSVSAADVGPFQPSGAPAIAAWAAASLGVRTAFVGAVGDDDEGALLRNALAAAGADPDALVVKPDLPTASADVEYLPDGSRRFEFRVANSAATALVGSDLGERPELAGWVHMSGSAMLFGGSLADTVVDAVRRGRAAGATVSIDPNLRAELDDATQLARLRELCLTADLLFPSDDELARLGLDEDELVARGAAVCTTLGADGARLRTGALDLRVAAVASPAHVVDPDGAGDTFAGAVIAGRLHGLYWVDAVHVASRLVARAIAVPGPMSVPIGPHDLSSHVSPGPDVYET